MKKRLIINISTILLLIVMAVALVGCNNNLPDGEYDIGNSFPDVSGKYKINKLSDDAIEMYEKGLKNYDYLDYVGSLQAGNITGNKFGTQLYLTSNRIKCTEDGYSGYYMDSYTQSIKMPLNMKVAIMEESVVEDGEYRIRKANKITVEDNKMEAKWDKTEYFGTVKDAVKVYPNDPTRMNMLIVNSKTIASATTPVYDAKTKTYTYTLELKTYESTKDYVPVMEYNTKAQGINAKNLKFQTVTMEVVMWSNGLFKTITTKEIYSFDFMGMVMTNNFTTYFTYDDEELPYWNKINFY